MWRVGALVRRVGVKAGGVGDFLNTAGAYFIQNPLDVTPLLARWLMMCPLQKV